MRLQQDAPRLLSTPTRQRLLDKPAEQSSYIWQVAWHPPPTPPEGTMHGSAAVCVTAGQIVLVTGDGQRWGLPGGRPEPGETWVGVEARDGGADVVVGERSVLVDRAGEEALAERAEGDEADAEFFERRQDLG